MSRPVITFHTDERLGLGEFGIHTRTVAPPEEPVRDEPRSAPARPASRPPAVAPPEAGNTMIFSSAERHREPLREDHAARGVPPRRALLDQVFATISSAKRPLRDRGWLDMTDRGHGFIVHAGVNYRLYPESTYVPEALIKRYGLKRGHALDVVAQAPQNRERCPSAVRIDRVMGQSPDTIANPVIFASRTRS